MRREGSEKRATKGDGCCLGWLSRLLGASRVRLVFRITETYLLKDLKTFWRHIAFLPRRGWLSCLTLFVLVFVFVSYCCGCLVPVTHKFFIQHTCVGGLRDLLHCRNNLVVKDVRWLEFDRYRRPR